MNIIEAMQSAENGFLITDNFLKSINCFLKYEKGGVFYQYKIVGGGEAIFSFAVRNFTMAQVLSTGWEVVEDIYFK
jgi:hypothetical protein